MTYYQILFNAGYMAVLAKAIFLLRSILVNTTKGTESNQPVSVPLEDVPSEPVEIEARDITPRSEVTFDSQSKLPASEMIETVVEDQPRMRRLYRQIFTILHIVGIVPFITAAVMGHLYPDAEHDPRKAKTVAKLRSVSGFAHSGVVNICLTSFQARYLCDVSRVGCLHTAVGSMGTCYGTKGATETHRVGSDYCSHHGASFCLLDRTCKC